MYQNGGLGQPNQLDTAPRGDVPCRAFEPHLACEGGYKMIESIDIENFRCFERASLDDLKTVNLIVGKNGSGKTAFLEALYFTLGSPALSFKMKGWRGLGGQAQYTEYTESRNAVWGDLFYQFDQRRTVKITFSGTGELDRSVRITCSSKEGQFIPKKSKASEPEVNRIPPIKFIYSQGRRTFTVKPNFTGDGIVLDGTPEPAHGSFYPSTIGIDSQETARHFSSLSKAGKVKPVVDAVHEIFKTVTGLSLEMNNVIPMIYADVEGLPEKVPLGLISSGLNRFVGFLVSIADQPHGMVIVDEIENGFYFERMADIWKTLRRFCADYDVQLFASTHSAECLKALEPAVSEYQDDFSLLRTVREEGRCLIRHFPGKQLLAALEEDIEIR